MTNSAENIANAEACLRQSRQPLNSMADATFYVEQAIAEALIAIAKRLHRADEA